MKKFRIPYAVTCTVYVEVEAEDKEEAIDKAHQEVGISSYVGNGGVNKMIGVYGQNMSIEPGEEFEVIEDCIEEI
ncbi:hypothetical protein ACVVIH_20560 [Chryseobacterium arthrosphaerae]|uniref:hypothetical protein n=1 Tax=Chryseobacterium arthrosphaerae TaxID=651561 RepID=UPI003D32C9C8